MRYFTVCECKKCVFSAYKENVAAVEFDNLQGRHFVLKNVIVHSSLVLLFYVGIMYNVCLLVIFFK